ncbi:hypothetical protein ACOMHN_045486 [Nucella lapillus]
MASNDIEVTMDADEEDCRVLTINSSPVFGYIGNKSTTFPLQMLGCDVSAISSFQSSSHLGYENRTAMYFSGEDVADLFEGLRVSSLLQFSYVLTGLSVKLCFLETVAETMAEMKKADPNLVYLCDPVMGDNGEFYVSKELVPIYREKLIPLADIITPNQFELEQLAGMEVKSEEEAFAAIDSLHDTGVRTVVLSSSTLGSDGNLLCLASSCHKGGKRRYRLEFPRVDAYFVGTGDLFSACLLAWMHKEKDLKRFVGCFYLEHFRTIPSLPRVNAYFVGTGDLFAACLLAWMHKGKDLKLAVEKTVATVQAVIKKTFAYATKAAGPGNIPSCAQMELRLIQCKKAIEDPQVQICAQDVTSLYSS